MATGAEQTLLLQTGRAEGAIADVYLPSLVFSYPSIIKNKTRILHKVKLGDCVESVVCTRPAGTTKAEKPACAVQPG